MISAAEFFALTAGTRRSYDAARDMDVVTLPDGHSGQIARSAAPEAREAYWHAFWLSVLRGEQHRERTP